MASPIRSTAVRLIPAVCLTAAVITIGAISFSRKAETFQPLGLTVETRAGHWLVTEVDSADSEVRVGDQILLINGRELGQVADPAKALRARSSSELVVLRAQELITVTHALPPLAIDFPYLILSFTGLAYLLIGFYTMLRDRRRPSLVFYLWCLTSALLYLASPIGRWDLVDRGLYVLDEAARILLAPLTLHLFVIFPRPLLPRERRQRFIPFLYLPAAFLLALQADLIFFDGSLMFRGSLEAALPLMDQLGLYHLVLFALAAVALLVWRLRHPVRNEPRQQATWIAVGMAGGYVPFLLLYLLPLTLDLRLPQPVVSLSVLPLALVPLTFAYAILRFKLWDIGVLVRDAVSLSLTVLVGVIGFSLANLVINRAVPDEAVLARTLVSFVSGLVIAGLLIPTRKGIGSSLERLQYGGAYTRRRALAEFGREMLEEHSLGRLYSVLLDRLRTALDLRHVALYLVRDDDLLPVRPQRDLPAKLRVADLGDETWRSEVDSLARVEFPTGDLEPRQRLFAAGYRYIFPLRVRRTRIGVLLAGHKEDEIPLSSDDVDLIRNLANQAALAIENAKLLDQVSKQLDEVVRLQRYSQKIFESSPAGIAVLDDQLQIQSANHAFAQLTGQDPERLVGRPLDELVPVGSLPQPGDGLREVSLTDEDGRERYLQLSVARLEDEEREDRKVIVVQDISERVAMENALKERERLASLGMLAAGVAHEVNTPITGISSYAQMLLADTPTDDPRRKLLEKVETQTFRAARIVNSLLDFARDRTDEHHPVSVAPLVSECMELLRERADEAGITLEWASPGNEVRVLGNEGELQQVFTNLMVNAVDAMADGGRLRITLECNDEWMFATFEDTGPGIPTEELEKIFRPFYSTKLSSGGTGLGLSISYNIVRRHGGEIRVVSRAGRGSRFIVELPRLVPDDPSESP